MFPTELKISTPIDLSIAYPEQRDRVFPIIVSSENFRLNPRRRSFASARKKWLFLWCLLNNFCWVWAGEWKQNYKQHERRYNFNLEHSSFENIYIKDSYIMTPYKTIYIIPYLSAALYIRSVI